MDRFALTIYPYSLGSLFVDEPSFRRTPESSKTDDFFYSAVTVLRVRSRLCLRGTADSEWLIADNPYHGPFRVRSFPALTFFHIGFGDVGGVHHDLFEQVHQLHVDLVGAGGLILF